MKVFLIDNDPLSHLTLLSLNFSTDVDLKHSSCTKQAFDSIKTKEFDWVICSSNCHNMGDGNKMLQFMESNGTGFIFLSKNKELINRARNHYTIPNWFFLDQNNPDLYKHIQQILECDFQMHQTAV